jgi:hypothetical protein
MANPAIPRDQVHALAEACGEAGDEFQSTATRLIKDQRRLSRFFEQNMAAMGPMPAQVSLYMLSVVLRIFEQVGGRMKKINGHDLTQAMLDVQTTAEKLMPADAQFIERAKAIEGRAQPHILDEVLWALYERDDEEMQEGEVDLDPNDSALVYMMLWTAVEALDSNWSPPSGWTPDA